MGTRSSEAQSYNIPETYLNLDETTVPEPAVPATHYRQSLETARTSENGTREDTASDFTEQPGPSERYRQHVTSARPDSDAVPGALKNVVVQQEHEPTALPRISNEPSHEPSRERAERYRSVDEEKVDDRDTAWGSTQHNQASQLATQVYTVSYLIFFSILGTLARLGLQALTVYPGTPVSQGVLWANFGGSLIIGFLAEDRKLFLQEWGSRPLTTKAKRLSWWKRDRELVKNSVPYHRTAAHHRPFASAQAAALYPNRRGEAAPAPPRGSQMSSRPPQSLISNATNSSAEEKKRHKAVKKAIPLYIGLSVGFCGSFTSFSSFQRDVFLALSNSARAALGASTTTVPRNGGYSFLALLATLILTPTLCLGALMFGAHLALFLDPWTPTLSFRITRQIVDRVVVFLAWGSWIGAIIMAVLPPDRPGGPSGLSSWTREHWRGDALFACVFGPLGCLVRFYASLALNGKIPSFPLGTFVVNIGGTALEAMFYDLQHRPNAVGGGRLACQLLQGMMDGFCGCLTTVSTWVAELEGLKRTHGYTYGGASLAAGLATVLVLMGPVRWTGSGFEVTACGV